MFQGNYFLNKLNWEKNIQKILKKKKEYTRQNFILIP